MRLWSMGKAHRVTYRVIGKLATEPVMLADERSNHIAYGSAGSLARFGTELSTYAGVLSTDPLGLAPAYWSPSVYAPPHLDYLGPGDVVMLNPSGMVSVLFRRSSPFNTILTTE